MVGTHDEPFLAPHPFTIFGAAFGEPARGILPLAIFGTPFGADTVATPVELGRAARIGTRDRPPLLA
ncbi:MAG: hypothetical protein ABR601_01385 [Parasphingopyxis sp.]